MNDITCAMPLPRPQASVTVAVRTAANIACKMTLARPHPTIVIEIQASLHMTGPMSFSRPDHPVTVAVCTIEAWTARSLDGGHARHGQQQEKESPIKTYFFPTFH